MRLRSYPDVTLVDARELHGTARSVSPASPYFAPGILVGDAHTPGVGWLVGKPRAWVIWQY
jgi:hypothetical protein